MATVYFSFHKLFLAGVNQHWLDPDDFGLQISFAVVLLTEVTFAPMHLRRRVGAFRLVAGRPRNAISAPDEVRLPQRLFIAAGIALARADVDAFD